MTILGRLLGPIKLRSSTSTKPRAVPAAQKHGDDPRKLVRVVHAGGMVESYHTAVPAVGIMAKYPRLILARPGVFQRPWESLVRPEEVLMTGEKFYLVPRGTVRKLQKRSRRHSGRLVAAGEGSDSDVLGKLLTSSDRDARASARRLDNSVQSAKGVARRKNGVQVRMKKVRFSDNWQPSLVSIDESSAV